MRTAIPDRRILKAFYTQYVAVLLIVLVFVVSGFQGPGYRAPVTSSHEVQKRDAAIGVLSLRIPQESQPSVPADVAAELSAVAEFVRNHDIRATFRVPIVAQNEQGVLEALQHSLAYSAQLRGHMLQLGVPAQAIRTVLFEAREAATSASVTFSSMEVMNERR